MMIRRHPGILLLLLLTTNLSSQAQGRPDEQKLDTVVADTIVVGEEPSAGNPAERTHLDTSFASAPEPGNTAPAAGSSPVLRRLPDTTVRRWQRSPKYAYANDPDYWKLRRERPSAFSIWLAAVLSSKAFRYTVLGLLGALLLYAIVRIVMDNNLGAFYRRAGKTKGSSEEPEAILEQEDIDRQLQHFLGIGDKRQATRYLYLKTLHLLSQRDLIRWNAPTTNQEYLRQLSGALQESEFRFLTGAYEKVWYGDFELSGAAFGVLHDRFMDFFKKLGA
jgi:hypothetical protein